MKDKPYIFVAGPYLEGDPDTNAACQHEIFDRLVTDRMVTPFAPIHFRLNLEPQTYQAWINDILRAGVFDAIIRIPAESAGYYRWQSQDAEAEVEFFDNQGLPTFADERPAHEQIDLMYNAIRYGHLPVAQASNPVSF